MFMQNTTPNQIATWRGFNSPTKPRSSTGSFSTIGRNTGITRSTIPTQSISAPRMRKISIITKMIPIAGRSSPTIMLAI